MNAPVFASSDPCARHLECGGCSQWQIPWAHQRLAKAEHVRQLFAAHSISLPEPTWRELPDRGLRDRVDFQIRPGKSGLWDQKREEILDLPLCPQLSPSLQEWWTEFRTFRFPIERGSVRLRVSPAGQRGVWLDFSNKDVKNLFAEKNLLRELALVSIVEIGQRRKRLEFENDSPKLLKEPRLETWTRTWQSEEPLPLWSRIADFSQVGDEANRVLVEAVTSLLPNGHSLAEFGSGNGNLTFAALTKFERVAAYEFDSAALEGLRTSKLSWEKQTGRTKALTIFAGDYQKKSWDPTDVDTILVNPARGGTGDFLRNLPPHIEHVIYMSCYPESQSRDLAALGSDWSCEEWILVDPFPHTTHVESLQRWSRR